MRFAWIAIAGICAFAPVWASNEPKPCERRLRTSVPLDTWTVADALKLDLGILANREVLAEAIDRRPSLLADLRKQNVKLATEVEAWLFADLNADPLFANLRPPVRRLLLENTGALQLENICPVQCSWCGFSHNQKAKYRQFSVPTVRSIFREIAKGGSVDSELFSGRKKKGNLRLLFYQSDGFNFVNPAIVGGAHLYYYPDLHQMLHAMTGLVVTVATVAPSGREAQVVRFLEDDLPFAEFRISVSEKNTKRLVGSEVAALIGRKASSSIPKVADALRYFLRERKKLNFPERDPLIRATSPELWTLFAEQPHAVRNHLVRVFRFNGINWDFPEFPYLYSVPHEIGHFGQNFKGENEVLPEFGGIGCFNGVLVDPDHVRNVVQVKPASDEFPDGQALVEMNRAALAPDPENMPSIPGVGRLVDILQLGIVQFEDRSDPKNWNRKDFKLLVSYPSVGFLPVTFRTVRYQGVTYAAQPYVSDEDVKKLAPTSAPRTPLPTVVR